MIYVYDVETFPNAFTLCVIHAESRLRWSYEISGRRDDSKQIIEFMRYLAESGAQMVGFNNIGFDYPILHQLMRMGKSDANSLYQKAMAIINAGDDEKFQHMVFPNDRYVEQIDLYKIHHFDNKARATSLKSLEFNMKMDNICDLPFKPGTVLTHDQIDTLLDYNWNDVEATLKFYYETFNQIKFREELVLKYPGRDWINFNDTKIGKEYFQMELEKAGVQLYNYGSNGRTPKQSKRMVIDLNEAILPWITFKTPEFQQVLEWLKAQKIRETKGVFKDLSAVVKGFKFDFGTGGIHGSVDSRIIVPDDENYFITDLDVASYYPNLAIANQFYPEHLGQGFCMIYEHLYEIRKKYPKGSTENAMLKLALNGTYGDSNNQFSVFYDPLFTMKITLNGQLLLCLLAERLMELPTLEMCQINTDGLTIKYHHVVGDDVDRICREWQEQTKLELESKHYDSMYIRDCNNYLAVDIDYKVKRKGAYDYETQWHQNMSALVVPKVAEKVLTQGVGIRETIENWSEPYDFMLRTKVPRSGYLSLDNQQIQNVSRYYVAKGGKKLWKWLAPLKGKTDWRKFAINAGWGVCVCNDITDYGSLPIDYEFYIQETEKLVLGLS